MKRLLSLVLAVCLAASCAVFFTACGDEKNNEFPVTVGGTEIREEPKRVVVLNDAFADIILYMGYDTKLVGRSVECDQQMMNVITSVGSAATPAIDTLESLEPDLVIADSTLSEKARNKITDAGISIVTLEPPVTQEEIKQRYIDLGTLLGGKDEGSAKGEESYEKLFELLDEYSTATDYIVITDAYLYLDENGNYCTFVKDTVESMIFGYNGAMNVFANKITPEFIPTGTTDESANPAAMDEMLIRYAAPTYLFLDGTVKKDGTIVSPVYDKLLSDPTLCNLSALKEGRVYFIPLRNFYRPGVTFEETLFTMIDELNKDEEAAEEASQNPTQAPTAAPTEAPTQAPTEAPADDVQDDGGYEENYDEGYDPEDEGIYY